MIKSKYRLAYLLNDRDLSVIFQKYIFQCYWCKKVTQRGKGVGIPLWSNGKWNYDYVRVCIECNEPVRQKISAPELFSLGNETRESGMVFH